MRSGESGLGRSSYRDQIAVKVSAEKGLTLEELDRNFELPVTAFIACMSGQQSDVSSKKLWNILDENYEVLDTRISDVKVDPWTSPEQHMNNLSTLIRDNDAFFQDVMTRWLQLSETLLNPMAIAAPRKQRGYLEMETFAAVSAVEQIQRELTVGRPTPFADSLKTKLSDCREALGLNSAERRAIFNAVKLSEFTLQQRLEDLVGGETASFFEWFFQDHVKEWAEVSVKVRNRLAHGLALPEGQSEDYGLLMDVLEASKSVIFLRLLLECGFPQDELKERVARNRAWKRQVQNSPKWPEYERVLRAGG
ncbi:HEPN domain-containing protein [Paenarthrobacter sp. NPDC056912]|uniref:HEPN domain-containing protein n=1 Tax=Paenarthrobacter sp. NPDC056912 TaxID=3345965 RepID=UPI003672FD99